MSAFEVCFSAATSACEKGHDWPKALEILQRMADERCTPDVVHFNTVLRWKLDKK